MSDLRHISKAFMTDFIELYKSFPCLWKTKSCDYKDRNKKDNAYMVLLKKLQEIEPNATKKTVTAKINSIRGSFRREMKKIEDSKRSGTGADDVYVTHLWYYDLLLFTKDQEMPRESVSNLDENRENESRSEQEADDENENTQDVEHLLEEDEQSVRSPLPTTSSSTASKCPSSAAGKCPDKKRKRKPKVDEQADEILTMVGERLRNNTANNNNDDEFDIIGKNVATKLRSLPPQTKLYTEKIINDLLFEAQIGNINKNSKIVTSANHTDRPNSYHNPNFLECPSTYYHQSYYPIQNKSAESQSTTISQHPMTPTTSQQLTYQNLERNDSATAQYDANNITKFFETYQPSEDYT